MISSAANCIQRWNRLRPSSRRSWLKKICFRMRGRHGQNANQMRSTEIPKCPTCLCGTCQTETFTFTRNLVTLMRNVSDLYAIGDFVRYKSIADAALRSQPLSPHEITAPEYVIHTLHVTYMYIIYIYIYTHMRPRVRTCCLLFCNRTCLGI